MPDQTKGPGFENSQTGPFKPKHTHIVAIAINKYEHGWDKLEYPVKDFIRLLKVLKEKYGVSDELGMGGPPFFDEKAIRDAVLNKLEQLRRKDSETGKSRIKEDENLIIIFSGHGHVDE